MYTLFASDLHLNAERSEKLELFKEFMDALNKQCEALYLLGDIFEFWHGDDDRTDYHQFVINCIASIRKKNIPVFVQKGNRDFLLGKKFERDSGCTLLPDPYTINLYGVKVLIMHGDLLCTHDHVYQRFRSYMHKTWIQSSYTALPLKARRFIAEKIRKISIEKSKNTSDVIMDVSHHTVNEYLQHYNVTEIIHGHTHRPNHHQWRINDNTVNRYVLGDWYVKERILYVPEEGNKQLLGVKECIKQIHSCKNTYTSDPNH